MLLPTCYMTWHGRRSGCRPSSDPCVPVCTSKPSPRHSSDLLTCSLLSGCGHMSGHDVHAGSADTRFYRSDCASRVQHDTHRKLLVSARVYSSVVVYLLCSTRTIAKASIFCAPYSHGPRLVPALYSYYHDYHKAGGRNIVRWGCRTREFVGTDRSDLHAHGSGLLSDVFSIG